MTHQRSASMWRGPTHCLAVAVWACACSSNDEVASTRLGRQRQAVASGEYDTGNELNFAPGIRHTDTNGDTFCTGFLAGRRFVVTASHCFVPSAADPLGILYKGHDDDDRQRSVEVVFAFDTNTAVSPDARVVAHTSTPTSPNPIFTRLDSYDYGVPEDRARDIAVITLDTRVPNSVAPIRRPAGIGAPPCAAEFDQGLAVGYGPTTFPWEARGVFNRRNFHVTDDYERTTHNGGSQTYDNLYFFLDYEGITAGDSGGPLLDSTRDRVCGVASAGAIPKFAPPLSNTDLLSTFAAVDAPDNNAFLRDILLSKTGEFVGERAGPDSDGDGVADVEDNCPNIPNGDQRDIDNDGVGDVCDNCVFLPNREQTNSNFEDEKRVNGNPPTDPRELGFIQKFWPGDQCDPNPLTVATPTAGNFAPRGNPRSLPCREFVGLGCPPPPFVFDNMCELSRSNVLTVNTISSALGPDIKKFSEDPEATTGGTTFRGLTRVLACDCREPLTREQCETLRCSRANVATPLGAGWLRATVADPARATAGGPFRNVPVGGGSFADSAFVQTLHVPLDAFAFSQDWGWAYWRDLSVPTQLVPVALTPDPSDDTGFKVIPVTVFQGLFWTWVRSFNPNDAAFPTPATPPTGFDREQEVRQSVSTITVKEEGNRNFRGPPCQKNQMLRFMDWRDCIYCGGGAFLSAFVDAVNPNPVLISPGRSSESVSPDLLADVVVTDMLDPTRLVLMASDAKIWTTGSAIRGVVLSRTNRSILRKLVTSDAGGVFEASAHEIVIDAATARRPRPTTPFLVALSGHRQELAFIERDEVGLVQEQLRTFDFDLNTEVIKPFLGRYRLLDPVAMTYRAEDDAWYILDRTGNGASTLTLYRLPRGNTLEPLGAWQRQGKFGNIAMTTGTDGTVVITSWNEREHAIAVLSVNGQRDEGRHKGQSFDRRRLAVVSLRFGSGAIEIPAYRNQESLTLVVRDAADELHPIRILHSTPKKKGDVADTSTDALGAAF